MNLNQTLIGDSLTILKIIPDELVDCVVTSPPYWGLRDYGVPGQLGFEKTPEEYVEKMVEIFREVKRVLKKQGTLWLNLGDTYSTPQSHGNKKFGNEKLNKNRPSREKCVTPKRRIPKKLKSKNLVGIPWRVAFALQADGWYLRSDIIWSKSNPMPESVTDRPTKSHEYIFLISKAPKYFYDKEAVRDPGHNIRTVWTIATQPYRESHFATYPEKLVERCIKAGCPIGGIVLDPFIGSGTTAKVAIGLNRSWIGIELNPEYVKFIEKRLLINHIPNPRRKVKGGILEKETNLRSYPGNFKRCKNRRE